MITRPQPQTKTVTTPDTGITVTLKLKQSYGDNKAIYQEALGNTVLGTSQPEAGASPAITLGQAQEMVSITLERMILEWDVAEADGTPTPLTRANIEDILTEKDVNFLMSQVKPSEESRKK